MVPTAKKRLLFTAFGVVFLLLQVFMIVYARRTPARYFCWAPYEHISEYDIQVAINGRQFRPAEILARYRRPAHHLKEGEIQHLLDVVQQYEETYGRNDHAQVVIRYRTNGWEEKQWQWPPQ